MARHSAIIQHDRNSRATADSGITYVCIQVKQGPLSGFTADDAIMC